MIKTTFMTQTGLKSLVLGFILSIGLAPHQVMSADAIDPQADKILKSMSSYLAETKAFSVNADIALDVVTDNGQKLQLSGFGIALLFSTLVNLYLKTSN